MERINDNEIPTEFPLNELLGTPRDRSLVEQRLNPFSTDRVVSLAREALPQMAWHGLQLRKEIRRQVVTWHCEPGSQDELGMSEEKLDALAAIVDRMASFYGRPDVFEEWAVHLALRERLGSTATGGFGLVHQFQYDFKPQIATANEYVDWWAFLFPEGVDYGDFGGQPIYLAFGHVFDRRRIHGSYTCSILYLFGQLMQRIADSSEEANPVAGAKHVANLGSAAAAKFLNDQLALCLTGEPKNEGLVKTHDKTKKN